MRCQVWPGVHPGGGVGTRPPVWGAPPGADSLNQCCDTLTGDYMGTPGTRPEKSIGSISSHEHGCFSNSFNVLIFFPIFSESLFP